jgi:hypothetical protein
MKREIWDAAGRVLRSKELRKLSFATGAGLEAWFGIDFAKVTMYPVPNSDSRYS